MTTTDDPTPLPCHKCGRPPCEGGPGDGWACSDCYDAELTGDPPEWVSDSITAYTIAEWNERTREAMAERDDRIVREGLAKMKGTT